jgi:hypothetical protein
LQGGTALRGQFYVVGDGVELGAVSVDGDRIDDRRGILGNRGNGEQSCGSEQEGQAESHQSR